MATWFVVIQAEPPFLLFTQEDKRRLSSHGILYNDMFVTVAERGKRLHLLPTDKIW